MELDDIITLIDSKYNDPDRNEESDPGGPYLIAYALVALTKEIRALRLQGQAPEYPIRRPGRIIHEGEE